MIDKSKFLAGDDDPRHYLREPMQIGEYVVYSNGHIVLIERGHTENTGPVRTIKIDTILDLIERAKFVKPDWPELPEKSTCQECGGSGKSITIDCPECDGDGFLTFENPYSCYQPDCETCGGFKKIKSKHHDDDTCAICNGTGKQWATNDNIIINGIKIQARYAELIIHEPDVKIYADQILNAIAFKQGEIYGAIMGMRQ